MSAAAAETFLEEFLELCVEDGVDDGVECTVDVAQPGDGAHQTGGDVTGQTHSSRRVDHKERSPAEQEAACILKTDAESSGFSRSWCFHTNWQVLDGMCICPVRVSRVTKPRQHSPGGGCSCTNYVFLVSVTLVYSESGLENN